ncbi:PepSY domain-containing protein [Actinacidiphila glaucinigra]|uniref:Peptidase propeptide and YPEB domain-containing protein n=1 Tax=Actinacidiphila glaucinigra TaxID=235986 RepID=A0A239KY37_9ACTN|nr:PepSY domain-containing protein [Actinacidiphila glaucinigra]SNT22568.1 Peptidase propeptide and YPEB domain-containing protein [Actinacidiphila glaucinigra]
MRRKTLIATAAAVAVLAGTGGVAAAAMADDDDRQRPAAVATDDPGADDGPRDDDRDDRDAGDDKARDGGTRTVSLADAVTAARAEAPGTVVSAELDEDRGRAEWEVETLAEDGTWHEVTIDAANGEVVTTREEQDRQDADEARDALRGSRTDLVEAAKAAAGARPGTVTSVSLDDDTRGWEVELHQDGAEHEFHVDPATGDTT